MSTISLFASRVGFTIRQLLGIVCVLFAAQLLPEIHAQDPSAPDGNGRVTQMEPENSGSQAPPPSLNPPPRRIGDFPPDPFPFFRGSKSSFPTGPAFVGFYLNLFLFGIVFGGFFLWVWSTHWVHEDASALKVRPQFWNTLVSLVGAAGFVLVLLLPNFALGGILLLAAYAVPLGLYIKERNDKVPESSRVMTPRHLHGVMIRVLARVGIHIGSGEVRDLAGGPPIRFIGKSRTGAGDDEGRSRQVESSRGYLAAKELIYDALLRRGTDVHLEPASGELTVRYRIDGVMYPTEPFDRAVGDAVINIFKVLSAMDITEKRKPQDGSFRAEFEDREIDFRVATQGTGEGEKMSLRILDQSGSVSTLQTLGMRKQLQDQVVEIIKNPHGMFLSCGPTGAGKSTTLYAALHELDAHQQNIITVEDPIEYRMKLVTQIEINTKGGDSFAKALRSILRQDPDVVLIGEMRDEETAKIACQAANTGHMVFSTVHANDSIAALFRIIDLGVEPFMLSTSISGILAQRLVRRLCEDCREAYKPNPEFLKKAGLPAGKIEKLYRPPSNPEETCPTCGGLGYKGRVGVFELLAINDRIRDLLRENPQLSQIRAEARKNGMLYMKEEGLRLVVKGITSVQELLRVVK